MAVRIFVSHSTASEPAHRDFRRALCQRLEAADFTVYVDEGVPASFHWRDVLFSELADCNAAVVLVNEQALKSEWVDTEVRILGWRAWIERKEFRLIVVPFGGVTPADIAAHKGWSTLALTEIQMIGGGRTLDIDDAPAVATTFDRIIGILGSAEGAGTGSAAAGWIVNTLRNLLPPDDAYSRTIAGRLGCALPPGARGDVLRRRLAQHLYEIGPDALDAFFDVPSRAIPADDVEFLLRLLRTYWIDPRASSSILRFSDRNAAQRIFAINGALHHFTPGAYVDQVFPTRATCPVFPVSDKWGAGSVLAQLRASMQERFSRDFRDTFGRGEATPEAIDAWANPLLKDCIDRRLPVFAALSPQSAADPALLTEIQTTYPILHLVLCTEAPMPGVEMLEPKLDPDLEAEAHRAYRVMGIKTGK